MLIERFVAQRRDRWRRFQSLLDRWDQRRLRPLAAEELAELGRLYRQATADLAIAQRDFPFDDVTAALNALVARGHQIVYVDRGFDFGRVGRFFTEDYPRAFRACWPFIVAAWLLMFVPGLLGYVAVLNSPAARQALVSRGAERMIRQAVQSGKWTDIQFEEGSSTSSFIMTNNIRVSLLAYAGGMLGGLGSVYIMISNGVHLGAVAAAAQIEGAGGALWSFVAAHGPIELTVIFVAGGAGLRLGWAMLRPGLLTRRDALVLMGRLSFVLAAGSVPLLVVAGLIEGFVSPSPLPGWAKGLIAMTDGTLLYAYLLLSGRRRAASEAADDDQMPELTLLEPEALTA